MLVCIVELKEAVAINAAVTMIMHAKNVSIDVDGNEYWLLYVGAFNPSAPTPKTLESRI